MRFRLQRNKGNCKQYRRNDHYVLGWDSASKEEPPRHPNPQLWGPGLPGPLHGRPITEVPCGRAGVAGKVSRGSVSLEVTKPPRAGDLPVGCPTCHGLSEHVLILKKEHLIRPQSWVSGQSVWSLGAVGHCRETESWGNHVHILSLMLQKSLMLQALGAEGAVGCRSWVLEKPAAHTAGARLWRGHHHSGSHVRFRSPPSERTRSSMLTPPLLQCLLTALP